LSTHDYDLKFSVAGRTILKKRFHVIHWDGFGKASLENFTEYLPTIENDHFDGFIVHSVEDSGQQSNIFRLGEKLCYVLQRYPRHVTEIRGSFDEFLGSLSSKTRSTLRRKVRKFATENRTGSIDWKKYSSAEEIRNFFAIVGPLAERTYQARHLDSALPSTESFRSESIEAAAKGNLTAYLLFLNERPVAYLYTPRINDTYFYDYLGYDEDCAQLSPGTVLQYLVHELLFNEGSVSKFDFTEGDGAHKRLFSNHSTPCATALLLNFNPFNYLLVYSHSYWDRSVEFFKIYFERFDLKAKFRRLLR
jgi:hypothetical protein